MRSKGSGGGEVRKRANVNGGRSGTGVGGDGKK